MEDDAATGRRFNRLSVGRCILSNPKWIVHELGHALVFARFGQPARIVLYHFGGLAIPVGPPARSLQLPSRRLLVAAAGMRGLLLTQSVTHWAHYNLHNYYTSHSNIIS